jgi:hypothetical protein
MSWGSISSQTRAAQTNATDFATSSLYPRIEEAAALMSADCKVDDLFRQHKRILQMTGCWLELPKKVQQKVQQPR